jgi:heme exporter protein D
MDVVPSIIVLAITTLLVFRRDLTTPRAQKRRPARIRRKTQHSVRSFQVR